MMYLLPQFASRHEDITPLLNTIHHCDAMDLLARLPDASVDMVLCDLPYGVTACKWDTVIPIEPMWEQLKRIVKPRSAIVLTATQPFTSRLVSSNYEMFGYSWVWEKSKPTRFLDAHRKPLHSHEDVLVFYHNLCTYNPQGLRDVKKYIKGDKQGALYGAVNNKYIAIHENFPRSIIPFSSVNQPIHPTEKPVALFEYLIKTYTQEHEIVLDMTCGSGTTAIACKKTNRQFICGDYHLPYVEIANQRLQATDPYQATPLSNGMRQKSLFEDIIHRDEEGFMMKVRV